MAFQERRGWDGMGWDGRCGWFEAGNFMIVDAGIGIEGDGVNVRGGMEEIERGGGGKMEGGLGTG